MTIGRMIFICLLGLVQICVAQAQTSTGQLSTGLTAFGAVAAGSADGSIPPYTGGIAAMTGLPAASATTGYPDPFAREKPIFSVTSQNMANYVDELTPGLSALLKRYPDYRLDIYPTHRTASYPAWVLANSLKNATSAGEIGTIGDGVTGAYGGIPFPVPRDGYQVMWNSALKYQPAYCEQKFDNFLVDTSGAVTDLGIIAFYWVEPYYDPSATTMHGNWWQLHITKYFTPAAEAGQTFLIKNSIDYNNYLDEIYYYSPGTRRVRLSPQFTYDIPISAYGGAIDWDEIDMFHGRMDRFNFRLIGKKEMIVPYNDYKFANATADQVLGHDTLNPDDVRWERHRVWIVDATLKQGERHIYSRWTFYIDEDSWIILASESYDHGGNIYRVGFSYPWQNYAQGDATNFAHTFGVYDLSKGNYQLAYVNSSKDAANGFYACTTAMPSLSRYNAQAMAAESIR
jgi:hypothetical protein